MEVKELLKQGIYTQTEEICRKYDIFLEKGNNKEDETFGLSYGGVFCKILS
jgi:esterase/lipase